MKKLTFFLLFTLTIFSIGCVVQRTTKFTSDNLKPGMSKEAVISLYGKPYKESSSTDNNQTLHETLFYKERLFVGRWYEINNLLHFENSAFKSIEQGKEQLLYKDCQVVSK